MRSLLLLALTTFSLSAQSDRAGSIAIGAKLGAPINEPSSNIFFGTSNSRQGRWTGGPTVEVQLPFRFSIEVDALYRNARTDTAFTFGQSGASFPYNVASTQKTDSWDIPLMLKYRFHAGPIRLFIAGGVQYTHDSTDYSVNYNCSGPIGSCTPLNGTTLTVARTNFTRDNAGPVAGAGIEFRTRYLSITPELRYSRPTNSPRDNRFTALVGFTFGLRK